ncbi:glycerophosphodiester phosphodiesterase [Microlunatus elymi]|uniref:glycerophosphodiester phosphodiesterase n=1 Tax=Microlunatus elymi TaxID=2596828 RepID=UPI00143D55B3|nr:glycerophosphodiester phosphodiesterase family protein [Microlunatus elymi]
MTSAAGQFIEESGLKIFAHRGFSGRYPESTPASYRAAIDYAEQTGIELGLECDVHFTADDQLVCLHDLTIDRTSDAEGPLYEWKLDDLRKIDFGSWFKENPSQEERSVTTLIELLDLIKDARDRGAKINLNLETKHPTPRGLDIEGRVTELLTERGWTGPDSPIRMITFFPDALIKIGEVLPDLQRTYLMSDLDRAPGGVLPEGVKIVGPDIEAVRQDPDFIARAHDQGNEVHLWTVNTPEDVEFCLEHGVEGMTTDFPDIVVDALMSSSVR